MNALAFDSGLAPYAQPNGVKRMVRQSASSKRETRVASGQSTHDYPHYASARSNDCGTNRLAASPPPRGLP